MMVAGTLRLLLHLHREDTCQWQGHAPVQILSNSSCRLVTTTRCNSRAQFQPSMLRTLPRSRNSEGV